MPADKTDEGGAAAAAPLHLLRPSKTRRKQDSHDLQTLGQALTEMPDDQLVALPLSEALLEKVYGDISAIETQTRVSELEPVDGTRRLVEFTFEYQDRQIARA